MSDTCPECGAERDPDAPATWYCGSGHYAGWFVQSDKCRKRGAKKKAMTSEERESLGYVITDAHCWAVRIFNMLERIERRLATMEARYYWEDRGEPEGDADKGAQ